MSCNQWGENIGNSTKGRHRLQANSCGNVSGVGDLQRQVRSFAVAAIVEMLYQ